MEGLTARAAIIASVIATMTIVTVMAIVAVAIITVVLESAELGPTWAAVCAVIVSTVRASMEIPALAVCIRDAFAATIPVLAKLRPRSVLLLLVPGRRVV